MSPEPEPQTTRAIQRQQTRALALSARRCSFGMPSRAAAVGLQLLALAAPGVDAQVGGCTALPGPVRTGLIQELAGTTEELARQFNMSFTVGVAMCDGSEIATSAGLDDRFARTPLRS